jgi:hypothetical protein
MCSSDGVEDRPSQRVSANAPNFVETAQEWYNKENLSDADFGLNCNELI